MRALESFTIKAQLFVYIEFQQKQFTDKKNKSFSEEIVNFMGIYNVL